MKCKDCNVWGCQHRTSNAEQECVLQNIAGDIRLSENAKGFLVPEGSAMTVDWDAFRREAAKDILCSVVANPGRIGHVEYGSKDYRKSEYVRFAIDCADELIRQLKQE